MCEERHFVVTNSGIMMLQMSQLSGKMVESKPLYVAIAQKKEDRRVRLQVCFSCVIYHLLLRCLSMFPFFISCC